MHREVFVLPDGESFLAWNLQFTEAQQRRESCPCTYHEKDGTVRKGTMHYTLETAKVSFCACPDSARLGVRGQLSAVDDKFFEVTISSLEPSEDHILVSGQASRMFDHAKDR